MRVVGDLHVGEPGGREPVGRLGLAPGPHAPPVALSRPADVGMEVGGEGRPAEDRSRSKSAIAWW